MKRTRDPVQDAIDLIREYQQLLRAGILVPQVLVDQAHCDLHRAIAEKRQQREQRKQQVKNAEDVHDMHPS